MSIELRTLDLKNQNIASEPSSISSLKNLSRRKALNRALELRYQIDARFQMLQQHGKHPIRKALHMQKCYPETIQRLNDNAVAGHRQVPMLGNPPRTPSANQETNRRQSQSSQFHGYHSRRSNTEGLECNIEVPCSSQEQGITSPNPRIGEQDTVVCTGTGNTAAASSVSSYDTQGQRFSDKEYHFCRAKMEYNRVKGQKAEVDDILTGISPLDKNEPLFPARATHQQLLGMVNRPTNPDEPAPAIPRSLKWLGDNIGWEGESCG